MIARREVTAAKPNERLDELADETLQLARLGDERHAVLVKRRICG